MVFQPTWSTCKCVHSTVSIVSRANPAAARSSRNRPCRSFQVGMRRSFLSLPRQVSTMMRRPGASTMRAWMLILRRPSASAKCGINQERGTMASRVAGQDEPATAVVSSSTILVTVTSPICHFIVRLQSRATSTCGEDTDVAFPARGRVSLPSVDLHGLPGHDLGFIGGGTAPWRRHSKRSSTFGRASAGSRRHNPARWRSPARTPYSRRASRSGRPVPPFSAASASPSPTSGR